MSEQTMTGPARLKFLAGNARVQGYKWLSGDMEELAALWEADRAEAEKIRQLALRYMVDLAAMTTRAERAEQKAEQYANNWYAAKAEFGESMAKLRETMAQDRAALERANGKIAYYEGDGSVRAYEALVGADAPRHKFTDAGICIRCGEDAEEWDAGCVEELAAEIEKNAAALERARALANEWMLSDGETYGAKLTAQMGRRLAALLSPEGGAA